MFQSISFLNGRRERLASSIKLLGALLFLAPLGVACSDTNPIQDVVTSPYGNEIQKLPSFFYRVTASYTLLETGEPVEFDYVVGCGGTILRSSYTSPTVWRRWHPRSMFQPTSNGEAVGVRTPNMCDSRAWGYTKHDGTVVTSEDTIPDDFLPLTIWYPDVDRMGWGIGYDSDVAYESPHARIAFNGASITKSDANEWLAWRDRAAGEYEQVGGLPGPWGWLAPGSGSTPEEIEQSRALNSGFFIQANVCYGAKRVALPESIREEILAFRPNPDYRFWGAISLPDVVRKVFAEILTSPEGEYNGADYQAHRQHFDQLGVLKRDGGGRVRHKHGDRRVYQDRFPVLVKQPQYDDENERIESLKVIILTDPAWTGFTFCGYGEPLLSELDAYFSGASARLQFGSLDDLTRDNARPYLENLYVRADGETYPVLKPAMREMGGSNTVDQSGYIFSDCCNLRG